MNLKSNLSSCNRESLRNAIWQSADTIATELELHLSSCENCRVEIEAIAADAIFWNKASAVLVETSNLKSPRSEESTGPQTGVIIQVDPRVSRPSLQSVEDDSIEHLSASNMVARILLDPPSHPEMLGRIDGFAVEQMIGRGGMGVVYKGFDSELHRPVAIKFLAPHLAANGVARKRFARESRAAAAVVHPNVVPIYSVSSSPVRPYLVMALVSGQSLQKHVQQHGPLPTKDVVRIGQQIAAGLAAAHEQGLVHRDIKPANILLENDVSRVMITDFGLARAADDAALTQSGWLAGTPHYMSPEQAMGNEVDHRSDLFSLGSVLYFLATGREPFRAEKPFAVLQKISLKTPQSVRAINSDVPASLEDLIMRLLEKDPQDRFESAAQAHDVMTRYLAHLQNPKMHAAPPIKKVSPKPRLRTRFIAALVVATLLATTAAIWIPAFGIRPSQLLVPAIINWSNSADAIATAPASTGPEVNWPLQISNDERWQRELDVLELSIRAQEQPPPVPQPAPDPLDINKSKLWQQIIQMEQRLESD